MIKKHLFPVLSLSAITFFLSLPSLHYGYLLDDYKNIRPYSLAEITRTFYSHWEPMMMETSGYRPLHAVHHSFLYWLLGGNPLRHRLFQMAIAISGVLLIYAFALRCTGDRPAAFWSALVYPCLGTNAWMISFLCSRQHLVQLNLILLTLLFFDRYLSDLRRRNWTMALVFFLLALLLKEEVVTLPLVLAAYALLVKGKTIRSLLRPLWPFFLAVILFISARAVVVRSMPRDHPHPPPVSFDPGKFFPEYGYSVLSTLIQTYGSHDPANWDFPVYGGGLSLPRDYIGFFSLLGFFIFGAVIFYRGGSVSEKKTFGFGLAVLLIGSIMVSAWYRNDRLFISSIGVAFMVGTMTSRSFRCLAWDKRNLLRLAVTVIAIVFFLSYLAVNLIAYYDLQDALHPFGARALRWDQWVYEGFLPWMKEDQIEIFKTKLRQTGREADAERISSGKQVESIEPVPGDINAPVVD